MAPALEMAASSHIGNRHRKRGGKDKLEHQFFSGDAVNIIVVICLDLAGLNAVVKQIVIGKHGQDLQHSLHIIGIMLQKRVIQIIIMGKNKFPVYPYQFSAAESILPLHL